MRTGWRTAALSRRLRRATRRRLRGGKECALSNWQGRAEAGEDGGWARRGVGGPAQGLLPLTRVVSGCELESTALVAPAVEVVGGRLHPRVVGVSRVVHVAVVDQSPVGLVEDLVEQLLLLDPVALNLEVARLLSELAPDRLRHHFTGVHHAARQRPREGVLALDRHHLQMVGAWVEPRHNRVGRMPPTPHAGAATRVARPTRLIEGVRQLRQLAERIGRPAAICLAVHELALYRDCVRRVGPALFDARGQHVLMRPVDRVVLIPRRRPRHPLVRHLGPLGIPGVLLRPGILVVRWRLGAEWRQHRAPPLPLLRLALLVF
eukprot:scaffold20075_cov109-Isochrysis_galbana.AAC.3